MAKVKHLKKIEQERSNILHDLAEMQDKGEIKEFAVIYILNDDEPFFAYSFGDEFRMIGIVDRLKDAIKCEE